MDIKIGDSLKIIEMQEEPHYNGREGEATYIDDMGQIHGTWGGLAIVPGIDKIRIINS